MIDQILDYFVDEKDTLEELLFIDNEKMLDNLTWDDYYNLIYEMKDKFISELNINRKCLFITEGNPIYTLEILRMIENIKTEVVIFINQGYLAMNKWLIKKFLLINPLCQIKLDEDLNYNKYINSDYLVIPIGEEALKEAVYEDFNYTEDIII